MFEGLIWMGVGAAGVVAGIAGYAASRKGWAYVQDWIKSRAAQGEAAFAAKVKEALGSDFAKFESDIAALKAKVGM